MVRYSVFKSTCANEEKEYESYGIKAVDSDGITINSVSDITCCKEEAEKLAIVCEAALLSPVHLADVCQDYIIAVN